MAVRHLPQAQHTTPNFRYLRREGNCVSDEWLRAEWRDKMVLYTRYAPTDLRYQHPQSYIQYWTTKVVISPAYLATSPELRFNEQGLIRFEVANGCATYRVIGVTPTGMLACELVDGTAIIYLTDRDTGDEHKETPHG